MSWSEVREYLETIGVALVVYAAAALAPKPWRFAVAGGAVLGIAFVVRAWRAM